MNILDLVSYGLPEFAVKELEVRGITELEPLQEQAVKAGLFDGKNLVVAAPTSSGKTLVAELAALFHITNRSGAVIVESLKALAYEKYLTFRESYSRDDNYCFSTTIATGDEVTDESVADSISLTVATYEKWYHLILEDPRRLRGKSLLVIDEAQMIADPNRGYRLEALLTWTKLRAPKTQIICLSATIPNAQQVADWLDAELVYVEKRSVPLVEHVWGPAGHYARDRDKEDALVKVGDQSMPTAINQVIDSLERDRELPVAIFCITKNDAESMADSYAKKRDRRTLCEPLVNDLDSVSEAHPTMRLLRRILPKGVAFHNANLSYDERRLIERAFRDGLIDVVFATPTLSAGVNLPIRTIVIEKFYRQWVPEYLSNSEYLNMSGRAGRKGIKDSGQSILLARSVSEQERCSRYLVDVIEPVESQMTEDRLSQLILQAIVSKLAQSADAFMMFINNTYMRSTESGDIAAEEAFDRIVGDLCDLNMIDRGDGGTYAATPLGKQVAITGIMPQTGKMLFDRLGDVSSKFEWSSREQYENKILLLATACPDLSPDNIQWGLMYVHREDDTRAILRHKEDFIGLVSESDLFDVQQCILNALVVASYIRGNGYTAMRAIAGYADPANVSRVASSLIGWMIFSASMVECARGEDHNPEFVRWLRHLAARLEFGVTDSAVELCRIARWGEVRGIGRGRSEMLAREGMNDLTVLLETDVEVLAQLLDSSRRAQGLREAVVRYLDQPTRHFQVLHENRASSCGKDISLVKRFYEVLGTDFNKASLALLQSIIPDAREQDLGQDAEPDLAIPVESGLAVIECKTKRSEVGTVNLHDAFEVYAKSMHLNPSSMTTLGKPAFDNLPIERAISSNICLITHNVFCEGIVRVWENKLTVEQFLRSVTEPGYCDMHRLNSHSQ